MVPQTVRGPLPHAKAAPATGGHEPRGHGRPGRDQFQEYSYTFRGVLTPIEFDVVGGDDAVRGLRIEVVDNPTIVEMDLDCQLSRLHGRGRRRRCR